MVQDWEPLVRLGVFEFNKSIGKFVEQSLLVRLPDDEDATGWQTYGVRGASIRVHVADGLVTSVACYDECILHGQNLIGMDFDEARRVIGSEPSEEVDTIYISEEPQEVFEFEDVEAQVWVRDGRVVTVFCGPRCEGHGVAH